MGKTDGWVGQVGRSGGWVLGMSGGQVVKVVQERRSGRFGLVWSGRL